MDFQELATPMGECVGEGSCWNQLIQWLRRCQQSHVLCNVRFNVWLPSRLIDTGIDGEPLVKVIATRGLGIGTGPYITLSHRWSSTGEVADDYKLKRSSLKSYMQEGIALARLPRAFVDAVSLTRRFGLRYLWIDSLCII